VSELTTFLRVTMTASITAFDRPFSAVRADETKYDSDAHRTKERKFARTARSALFESERLRRGRLAFLLGSVSRRQLSGETDVCFE